jgi:RNase P subunit RPR2
LNLVPRMFEGVAEKIYGLWVERSVRRNEFEVFSAMPELSSIPRTILRPACPKCSTPMNLARIAPDEEGIEDRLFECPNCGITESWIFKS